MSADNKSAIKVILPENDLRGWHAALIHRLRDEYQVFVESVTDGLKRSLALDIVLRFERLLVRGNAKRLAEAVECPELMTSAGDVQKAVAILDLSGRNPQSSADVPVITVKFDGSPGLSAAALGFCRGRVPDVDLYIDNRFVERASPMADSRVLLSKGLDDVLARTISFVQTFLARLIKNQALRNPSISALEGPRNFAVGSSLAWTYVSSSLPKLLLRFVKQRKYYPGHWFVGFRFIDGPGVFESGTMKGEKWQRVSDDRKRFYADPFPFLLDGNYYLFVEELEHKIGKGVISVAKFNDDETIGALNTVLEEPYHLSYPQVFALHDEIWMIPESGDGRQVAIYRSVRFPDVWEKHAVLIEDREIFDATLFSSGNYLWLVATERAGGGSASDTMVLFYAHDVFGPWIEHRMNPVLIDKALARPGGRPVVVEGQVYLLVQDGTDQYGGGINILEITHLDPISVQFGNPRKILACDDENFRHAHTLNRCGRLEVIDGYSEQVARS